MDFERFESTILCIWGEDSLGNTDLAIDMASALAEAVGDEEEVLSGFLFSQDYVDDDGDYTIDHVYERITGKKAYTEKQSV